MHDDGMEGGDLFITPRRIVWAYRAAAVFMIVLYLTAARTHFGVLALVFFALGAWFGSKAVLVTDAEVLVSTLSGPPRRAPYDAIIAVQADAGAWALRMVDGSRFHLPPVEDRDAVIAAIRRHVPRVRVDRLAMNGGWIRKLLRRER
ncbi:MAG: hypothetical protein AAGA99_25070 [Actinomycetota bacterium]